MPEVSLNLNNFLKHVNQASNSDTLVMRDDGKTSERGFIRTAFTGIERYRETTRQFIESYCREYGADVQFANDYFAENLRGENAVPLSARKVKGFLAFEAAKKDRVSALEAQTTERAARLEAFQSSPEATKALFERVKGSFSDTTFMARGFGDDPQGVEVMNEIQMAIAKMGDSNYKSHSLYCLAKGILDDGRLTKDQCIRRLNILTNFIDTTDRKGCKVNHEDVFERAVFQRLLEGSDSARFEWNTSADRMLAQTFVGKGNVWARTLLVETIVNKKVDLMNAFQTLVSEVKNKTMDEFVNQLLLFNPIPGTSKNKQRALLKGAFENDTFQSYFRAVSCNFLLNYRTVSVREFSRYIATQFLANPDPGWVGMIAGSCPGFDTSRLKDPSVVQRNLEKFTVPLTLKHMIASPNVVSTSVGLISAPESVRTPEVTLHKGRTEFLGDFNRHFSVRGEDCRLVGQPLMAKNSLHLLFDKKTSKGYVECDGRNNSDRFRTLVASDNRTVESLSDQELEAYWSRACADPANGKSPAHRKIINRFMDKMEEISGDRKQQVGAALVLMAQNQDDFRDMFSFLGGTVYDKAAIFQEDGSLRVVYASRKDSPVALSKVITVDVDGNISFDENETYLTTNQEEVTQNLRDMQDFFAKINNGYEESAKAVETTMQAAGETASPEAVNIATRDVMYNEGISI